MHAAKIQMLQGTAPMHKAVPDFRIVIVGHVDHGKSTLVGRLLYETGALADGKYESIKQSCDKRGMAFEWAFLMDALQAERDQNVTIDTTQIWFSSTARRYCLIDAPGHREFLKNMITGAASADAALLLVDAQEGLKAQSRRHAYLLHMLGIRKVIVVVNKMDLVAYQQQAYDAICEECTAYLAQIGVTACAFVPLSAREGEGMTRLSDKMPWYSGAPLLAQMDALATPFTDLERPLRFAVQDIYRFDERRIIAGRIESGQMQVGDVLLFSPSNETARVKRFEIWPQSAALPQQAAAGQCVGITLEEQIFVERGHLASHVQDAPHVSNAIAARVFWMADRPLTEGARYRLKLSSAEYAVEVKRLERALDTDSLTHLEAPDALQKMQVGELILKVKGLAAMDDFQLLPRSGRFVLVDGFQIVGGGIITTDRTPDLRKNSLKRVKSDNITAVDFEIGLEQRAQHNGHKSGVLWFTGLSGSGKSTLAKELQKRLFEKGYQVFVLDGDNMRYGLCSDLGFSPEDRAENIRRVGEVANLFASAGMIVITAFISPYTEDRRRAQTVAADYFHTVYIKADIETCEQRDVKGLYRKARAGEIKDFTGVSAPYEVPQYPDLVIDTAALSIDESITQLLAYVVKHFSASQ